MDSPIKVKVVMVNTTFTKAVAKVNERQRFFTNKMVKVVKVAKANVYWLGAPR